MLKTISPSDDVPGRACWSLSHTAPTSARDRILVAAATLFCRQGISATGIDTVIEHAGTAKATLYKHFSSKQDLTVAVLDAEGAVWRKWFFSRLHEIEGPAEHRILAMFDVYEEWFAHPDFYGCPFINAVGEVDSADELVRKVGEKHKARIRTWISAIGMELGAADPAEFTRAMIVLIDGAIVAAQHARDPSFARTAKTLAAGYVRDGLS